VCTTDACDAASRDRTAPRGRTPLDIRVFPNLSNRLAYHWQLFLPVGFRAYLNHALDRRPRFDVAHLHACHNLLTAMAARALAARGIPYVIAPNGTALPIERRITAKRLFAATAGRTVLSGAARVVAVSEAEGAQLMSLGVRHDRIATIGNPIDPDEFVRPLQPDRFRQRHRLSGRIVLFLGKLTPRKGVDVLVRAFTGLRPADTTLVIAGNDMGSGAAVDALTAAAPRESRIVRIGLLRGEERLDALAAATLVVYPSRDEVFGLVPLEALMCGTPVVVCGDSGCGEIVGRLGGGLIVAHGDVPALSSAMSAILDDEAVWRSRAQEAAPLVRSTFGVDTICGHIEDLYRTVLDATTGRERMSA
jgi:glycosyltransferase involved in cell wall biosynthesis